MGSRRPTPPSFPPSRKSPPWRTGGRFVAMSCLALAACRLLGATQVGPVHPSAMVRGAVVPERFTFSTGCVRVIDGPCPPGDEDGIEARTVAWLDGARHSLHAALYELSLPSVTSSLLAARHRGVDVRVHVESDSRSSSNQARNFQILIAAGIPLTFDERPSLMHDKFIVRDGEAVWTGSANLTWPGVHLHYNEAVFVEDVRVAALYQDEFARLQGHREPDSDDEIHTVETPEVRIRVAFAARGPRETLLMEAIRAARREIRVAAFSLTHRGLVEALSERAAAGVAVEVVLDGRNARAAPAQEAARRLQNAGCRVSGAVQTPAPRPGCPLRTAFEPGHQDPPQAAGGRRAPGRDGERESQ